MFKGNRLAAVLSSVIFLNSLSFAQKRICDDCEPPPPPSSQCDTDWCPAPDLLGGVPVDVELRPCDPGVSNCFLPTGSQLHYVLAVVQGGSAPGVFLTTDWKTFHQIRAFAKPNRMTRYDPPGTSDGHDHVFFVATSDGLYRAPWDFTQWTKVAGGLPEGEVTFVTGTQRESGGPSGALYATVDSASPLGGLYRSNDGGSSWQRVEAAVDVRSVNAVPDYCFGARTVFAGGRSVAGGLAGALWISRDDGLSWSSSSFSTALVNDVAVGCGTQATPLFASNGDTSSSTAVWASTDLGSTFSPDNVGIPVCCATDLDGRPGGGGGIVGTVGSGLMRRSQAVIGSQWTTVSGTGLTDFRINDWIDPGATVEGIYFVATPSGIFYVRWYPIP